MHYTLHSSSVHCVKTCLFQLEISFLFELGDAMSFSHLVWKVLN